MSTEDRPEIPRLYLIPESDSQEWDALHQKWRHERAAALAVLLEHFTKEAGAFVMETVLELEGIQARYAEQLSVQWRRTAQGAYERGQLESIRELDIIEDVGTGKIDPENGPPPTPPDTLH